jgi:vancomycin permeability regulator SanA
MHGRTLTSISRGLALFLGGFTLLNAIAGIHNPNLNANEWWIDCRALPGFLGVSWLAFSGIAMVCFAAHPRMRAWRRRMTLGVLALLFAAAAINGTVFYLLVGRGLIHIGVPVPFSFLVLGALAIMAMGIHSIGLDSTRSHPRRLERIIIALSVLGCMVLFPVGQIYCFGSTDYRRQADAIVVLGARAYADGTPSPALADRVRTACELYSQRYAPTLIFSGGPGDGAISETESMRRFAVSLGVPDAAIISDTSGVNTAATVAHTLRILSHLGARRVLVVSHYYHLPRVKLCFALAGRQVFTVPAEQTCILPQMPLLMGREVVGLWAYYLDPLLPARFRVRS